MHRAHHLFAATIVGAMCGGGLTFAQAPAQPAPSSSSRTCRAEVASPLTPLLLACIGEMLAGHIQVMLRGDR